MLTRPIAPDSPGQRLLTRPSKLVPPQPPAHHLAPVYVGMFDSVLADTEKLLRQAYRLRYEVYCLEREGFEDADDHPDGMETDDYDRHALQGLLRHRYSGLAVGAVRMILPQADNWQASLPIRKLCGHALLHRRDAVLRSLEVSRFCISRQTRKQLCREDIYRVSSDQHQDHSELLGVSEMVSRTRHLLPYLCLGLIKLPLQVAAERNLDHIFATLDPRLLQLLTQFGVCSTRLGDDIDHHGMRSPVDFVPLAIFENTYRHKREVWKIITDNGRLHDLARGAR